MWFREQSTFRTDPISKWIIVVSLYGFWPVWFRGLYLNLKNICTFLQHALFLYCVSWHPCGRNSCMIWVHHFHQHNLMWLVFFFHHLKTRVTENLTGGIEEVPSTAHKVDPTGTTDVWHLCSHTSLGWNVNYSSACLWVYFVRASSGLTEGGVWMLRGKKQ